MHDVRQILGLVNLHLINTQDALAFAALGLAFLLLILRFEVCCGFHY
jgi:hypothetical protein